MRFTDLKAKCQPFSREEMEFDERVIRKISIYFTYLCVHLGLHANTVTLGYFSFGLVASLLIAISLDYMWFALLILWSMKVLDCVDGELARYYEEASLTGLYLDRLCSLILPIFVITLSISMSFSQANLVLLVSGLGCGLGFILHRFMNFLVAICLIDGRMRPSNKNPVANVGEPGIAIERESLRKKVKKSLIRGIPGIRYSIEPLILMISGSGILLGITLLFVLLHFKFISPVLLTWYFALVAVLFLFSIISQLVLYSSNHYVDRYYIEVFGNSETSKISTETSVQKPDHFKELPALS